MHVKAKKIAFGGMLLALTIIFMMLGSIIETGTLFLLAAASFCRDHLERIRRRKRRGVLGSRRASRTVYCTE